MVLAIVFVLVSCDTDPNELGGDFLGVDIAGTIIQQDFEAKAFSASLNPVQTNNFSSVQLGTFVDSKYGETKYGFVTQLSLGTSGVDFGLNRRLDSVVLNIPYFSRVAGRTGEDTEYVLDSVYGPGNVDVKIFENRFFLSSFDPNNVVQPAIYFSDFGNVVQSNLGAQILPFTGTGASEPELINFKPKKREVRLQVRDSLGVNQTAQRQPPALRQRLDPEFWQQRIFDLPAGSPILNSDSNFQNYLRGLYFTVENTANGGVMTYFNLNDAAVILYYNSDIVDVNDTNGNGRTDDLLNITSTFRMNLRGSTVVLTESSIPQTRQAEIDNSFDPVNGSDRIYLKGGAGAISFIDLFGPDSDNDGEADALTELKAKNVLVNEASLEFYVDQSAVDSGSAEPERILIYDFVTRRYLFDFQPPGAGANSNLNHLGRLERASDGKGFRYKIRLTSHIAQILQDNVANNRLALVVSQNIDLLSFSEVKSQTQPLPIRSIPIGAAISHEGTVLHGNLSSDESKRLKLRIFYTEPN